MIVVDASVVTKWFLKEEHSELAIAVPELGRKLVGPMLAQYEVAGTFSRAVREKRITPKAANECLDRWLHSLRTNVMQLSHDRHDLERGHQIALEISHPTADCIYLAMAERLSVPLLTADEKFVAKTHQFDVVCISDAKQLAA